MFPRLKEYFTYSYDRNIVEFFKPLYILLSITGLFPYTVEFPKGRFNTRIVRKPLVSHSFGAILLIAFLSFIFTKKIENLMNTAETSSVTNVNNIIEIILALLCAVVIYLSAFWNANTYFQILQDISICWAELSYVNVIPIITFLRELFTYPAIAWLVIFSSVQISLGVLGTQKVYNQLIFFTMPDAIPSLIVAFYSAMVLLIIGLLKNIEEHCQILVNTKRVKTASTNGPETNVQAVTPVGLSSLVRLENLEQTYVKVLEIKQEVNNAFQAPISLIIIQCFHGILSDAHTLYREIVANMNYDAYELLDQTFWMLYSVAKVYALTFTGSLLKAEAVKIGQTLHNIPTTNQDNRLLMEVQHFATLMSFRKPVVTVYDYFSLDATLLFSGSGLILRAYFYKNQFGILKLKVQSPAVKSYSTKAATIPDIFFDDIKTYSSKNKQEYFYYDK